MKEKVIIKSRRGGAALKMITLLLVLLTIASAVIIFEVQPSLGSKLDMFYETHHPGDWRGKWDTADNEQQYEALRNTYYYILWHFEYILYGSAPLALIFLILYLYASKMEVTVTDKRVYGKSAFGKRVDLPLDSISAVGTGAFNGLAVASSSGKIHFMGIKNRDEIHEVISDLLMERQGKRAASTTIRQEVQQSSAEELKKFKELLDSGIISQEEYNAKKKAAPWVIRVKHKKYISPPALTWARGDCYDLISSMLSASRVRGDRGIFQFYNWRHKQYGISLERTRPALLRLCEAEHPPGDRGTARTGLAEHPL